MLILVLKSVSNVTKCQHKISEMSSVVFRKTTPILLLFSANLLAVTLSVKVSTEDLQIMKDKTFIESIAKSNRLHTLQSLPKSLAALKDYKQEEKEKNMVDLGDKFRTTPMIIESRGYICETHHVTTKDGYIIDMHRIVNPLLKFPGKPVLLMHGFKGSSADWVIQNSGEHLSHGQFNETVGNMLGFVLARRGYDVWLGNSRGNRYGQAHVSLDPKVKAFWEFSFNEIAEFDSVAMVDCILKATQAPSVAWIGYSSGANQALALMSLKAEYNVLLKPVILMAPTVYNYHSSVPMVKLFNNKTMQRMVKKGGMLSDSAAVWKVMTKKMCSGKAPPVCEKAAMLGLGAHCDLDWTRLEVYLAHAPSSTSTWNFVQYLERFKYQRFAKFDYLNDARNILEYQSNIPPEYPIDKIYNPYMALITSIDDKSAPVQDIHILRQHMKAPFLDDYVITRTGFGHLDFIWGKDVGQVAYSRVLHILSLCSS
ncbi:Lipase 3 [Halotydeus destructor]|nr:Lipase 3 [Halotydeus destructor]